MQKISYVNGRYVPHHQAAVHIEDRGYQFADGIYEVIALENGVLVDGGPHLERLERSLASLEIRTPMSQAAMKAVMTHLFRLNHCRNGCIYIQVTRGVAKRNHDFPKGVEPALVMTVSGPKTPSDAQRAEGVASITYADIRWGRRDIKSVSLLPNILAKEQAVRAKVREAWLHEEDGTVTEGSSSNTYLVSEKGVVITHPANLRILGGITRHTVLNLAREAGIGIEERPFTLSEIGTAREAFLTSTTSRVLPVVKMDGKAIGQGRPGEVTQKLMRLYDEYINSTTGN
jgi:D-alanine transaminase